MTRFITSLALLAAPSLILAACTSPQQQRINRQRAAATQFLERQGSIGDPGRVAAADFAFARMAREEGQWTAFRRYAAPDAVRDAPEGYAPASQVLAGLADPAEPLRWEPTNVWSSCDGTLAASLGRWISPGGIVGDYVTIWELQPDNSYKWIYDTGTPDDPQPAPQPVEELPEGAIVVQAIPSIQGRIADCPPKDEALAHGAASFAEGAVGHVGWARDATLSYAREMLPDGSRRLTVDWWRNGAEERVVDMTIPAQP